MTKNRNYFSITNILLFISIIKFSPSYSQDFIIYHDKLFNKTHYLTPKTEKICIEFSRNSDFGELLSVINKYDIELESKRLDENYFGVFVLPNGTNFAELKTNLLEENCVNGVVQVLIDQDGCERYLSPTCFAIQFHQNISVAEITELLEESGSKINVKHFTDGYYTVTKLPNKTIFESIQYFNELVQIKFSEPVYYGFNDFAIDTYLNDSWHLKNTGQRPNFTIGNDIKAIDAWDITKGNPNVIVVIIDTGIDQIHPDLYTNILPRGNEDWDFSSLVSIEPIDLWGHGTAIAGIVAAIDNDIGVRGIAPYCKIMPLKIGDNYTYRADAINYAVSRKNNFSRLVINGSWSTPYDVTSIHNAIINAYDNNIPTIFASQNGDSTNIPFPAKYQQVISVGAMAPCGSKRKDPITCDNNNTWGSNYGIDLCISAPGTNIYTTDLLGNQGFNPIWNWPNELTNLDYTNYFHGTSSACSMVSATIALMLSVNPNLSVSQIRSILQNTADKVGGYNYYWNPSKPGHSLDLGYGRINAHNAVNVAQGHPAKPRNLTIANTNGHPVLKWSKNTETNLIWYKIYRARTTGGEPITFDSVAYKSYTDTTWEDVDMIIGSGTYKVFYKVSAVNNSYKESILSDYAWTNYDPEMQKIRIKKYDYSLSECYPNPFNPTTKIKYSIKEQGLVTLKVYDLLGREIVTLVKEQKEPGEYEIEFNVSKYGLSSGMYLYQLKASGFTSIKKFVLAK